MYTQKSFTQNTINAERKWLKIDATGKTVGRLATEIATLLRGKHKPSFTPNADTGDFVVVTNCEKVNFTGNKWDQKTYYWHTGFMGGIKSRTAREQLERKPELIIQKAVKGMLPKTSLGRKQLTKLKVYVGDEHPHEAQKLEDYNC